MKTFRNLAATVGVVILIAVVVVFTRNNWGPMADSAISYVASVVTGEEVTIELFGADANSTNADDEATADKWN